MIFEAKFFVICFVLSSEADLKLTVFSNIVFVLLFNEILFLALVFNVSISSVSVSVRKLQKY